MKSIIITLLKMLKKKWWYFVLVTGSSAYVLYYRYEIYGLTELTARNLIFILWLVLLGLPLFSEIEIGNVKLKKEVERTRAEVKEAVHELRLQVMELKVSNSNTVVVSPTLPTKEELVQFEKGIDGSERDYLDDELFFGISPDALFLFQVRLTLENLLSTTCDILHYSERKSMHSMVEYLLRREVINGNIAGMLHEIVKIANRGVHGEIIDEDYLSFVKKAFPTVKRALEQANQNALYA